MKEARNDVKECTGKCKDSITYSITQKQRKNSFIFSTFNDKNKVSRTVEFRRWNDEVGCGGTGVNQEIIFDLCSVLERIGRFVAAP